MASNLRVDNILPSQGTTLGIGTAGGTINFLGNSNLTTSGDVTIGGDLGVGGTITYEDVARVDATGISTFREGFGVGPLTGIALTAYKDGSIRTSGIITASSFVGDGSGLTNAGPSLTGSTNNTLVTVTGANAIAGEQYLTFNGTGDLTVTGDENTAANLILVSDQSDNTADEWRLSSQVDNLFSIANDDSGSFVNKVEMHKAGNVTITQGNLVIGTAGKGIDFSATGDGAGTDSSELLADYEEGTWTPVPSRYSSPQGAINCSMSTQLGRYRKIGKLVQVEFYLSISSVTSQGGNLTYIAGLPYAPVSAYMGSGNLFYNSGLQHDNVGDSTWFVAPHTELSSILYFRPELQAGHGLSTKNWQAGHVTGSVTYQTTA